jgi:PAS domain S-box-containing protein
MLAKRPGLRPPIEVTCVVTEPERITNDGSSNGSAPVLAPSVNGHHDSFGLGLSENSLRDFIESSPVAMHSVSGDGRILWANRAELDLLGYSREEYIGFNITHFHADKPVIDEILLRLSSGETLRGFPARLRCKDGSIRHVVIDSSVLFENGEFIHTRCVTRDVTREVEAEQKLREAEKWYRELLEALPVAVYTTDAEGHITQYNQKAAEFAGRFAVTGKDKWCVTHRLYRPDGTFLPHEKCPMAIALRTGKPVRGVEAIAERPDGTRVHFMPYPTPLLDDRSAVIGGVNVLVDITDRKCAEEARAKLAAIVESSDDAIVSKDLNGIIQSWNAGAQRIFGYTQEETIGRPIIMLIPPEREHEETAILQRIRRGERIEHYETVRRRKDGSLLDISLTVSPVIDEPGRIVGASKIARDVTERKRTENDLRRANADLEQFAYSASHDLQEPIRNVAVYADILNRRCGQALDGRGKECVDIIRESASRMDSLVKALLAYIQSGSSEEAFDDVDLASALDNALINLAATIQEAHAEVTHDALPVVRMRSGQIEHVFQNLIGNAVKYRREGEPPRIHITAERANDEWRVGVKDNGIGIAPEYKDRVFGIFKRLHNGPKYAGAGIGLAICKRIVERHGGRIWVESDGDGKGSMFHFTLPAPR